MDISELEEYYRTKASVVATGKQKSKQFFVWWGKTLATHNRKALQQLLEFCDQVDNHRQRTQSRGQTNRQRVELGIQEYEEELRIIAVDSQHHDAENSTNADLHRQQATRSPGSIGALDGVGSCSPGNISMEFQVIYVSGRLCR